MSDSPDTARNEMIDDLRARQRKGCEITDQQIEIVVARICEGATYDEIGRTVDLKSASAVRAKFLDALEKLRPYN